MDTVHKQDIRLYFKSFIWIRKYSEILYSFDSHKASDIQRRCPVSSVERTGSQFPD